MQSHPVIKILEKIVLCCFCLLFFALPLVFYRDFFFGFEFAKVEFFRILLVFLYIFQGVVLFFEKIVFLPRISKWFYFFLGGFLMSVILATVFSLVPYTSFFGSHERQQGVLQLFFYILFFVVTILFFTNRREKIKNVFEFALLGGFLVSILTILQRFYPEFLNFWNIDDLLGRQSAILGHPNFLAAYLVLLVPFCFVLKKKYWRYLLFLLLLALVFTGSRAAALAFFVEIVLILFFKFSNKKLWLIFGSIFFVFLIFVGRLFLTESPFRSLESRIVLWSGSVRQIVDRPVFGYGPEMFKEGSLSYISPKIYRVEKFKVEPDRAHNEILDSLVSFGLLGSIFYFLFWGFLFLKAIKSKNILIKAVGVSLAGLFVNNFFSFSVTVHYVFFWFFAAVILIFDDSEKIRKSWCRVLPFFVSVIVVLLMRIIFLSFWAEINYKKAILTVIEGRSFAAIDYFRKAVDLYPFQTEYYLKAGEYALIEADKVHGGMKMELMERADWFVKKVENKIGNEMSGVLYLKALYAYQQGEFGKAGLFFEKLSIKAPFKPKYILAWARFLKNIGQTDRAFEKYNLYLSLMPEVDRLFLKNNPEFPYVLEEIEILDKEVDSF